MSKLFIIAGPQSSGKSTVWNLLKNEYRRFNFIPETNQYSIVGNDHPGGAFVTYEIEKKILDRDVKVIKSIDRKRPVSVIETGIFHLLYAEKICDKKTADVYFKKYLKAHKNLEPVVIFIDTKPPVSWHRRRKKYLARIHKSGVTDPEEVKKTLLKYRKTIFNLYPLWIKYLKKIPFRKVVIKNTYKSRDRFLRRINKTVKSLL